ncbi:unnamed protein product [Sphagnum tenellum]
MAFWKPGTGRPGASSLGGAENGQEDGDDGSLFIFPSSRFGSGGGLQKQRQQLPVFKHRKALLYLAENHGTTIVLGETGSGKSTQIPQYFAEAGWAEGGRMIACTQSRRIAAQTVAARVAEEMGVPVGAEVGYCIRFEEVTTPGVTRIKYLTDGVLLREMMADPLLSCYSVIMVDEAHERSIATDMLLGLLKKIQRRRPELRLIIASATLDAESFFNFFDSSTEKQQKMLDQKESMPSPKPAILSVEGRAHSVLVHYAEEPVQDYLRAAVSTTLSIHKTEGPGDVLVFLTGQDDVDAAVQLINEEAETLPRNTAGLLVLPLYAGLPHSDQELVLGPTPRGKRKVIVATNIAETSVTLEGIVYVVDSGFSKQRFYNPMTDVEALVVAPVSQASAKQRAGRAGRVRPGKCFRLYTEEAFLNEMRTEGVPEMQRSNLVSAVLQLKALGIDNIMRFHWLAPPPAETMVRALEILYSLGVLDAAAKLTSPLGFQIAELPLEPMTAKMLLSADREGCSQEALTIAATLSVQSIWVSSRGMQKELDEAREHFAVAEGDHVTFLNVYEGFRHASNPSQWCYKNCVNYQAMRKVMVVREQLSKLLQRLGVHLQSCGSDTEAIRKAVTAGFFSHAAKLEAVGDHNSYRSIRGNQELYIHPSSVLFRATPKWVVFHSVFFTERYYMREVTAIDPAWLVELAPHFFQHQKSFSRS